MKKTVAAWGVVLCLAACLCAASLVTSCDSSPATHGAAALTRTIEEIRKGRPWIPATTTLVSTSEGEALADNVDYPFVTDPAVLGSWHAVDFVQTTAAFTPDAPAALGGLWLQSMTFTDGGVVTLSSGSSSEGWTERWTKGHVLVTSPPMKSDATYEVVTRGGRPFLFFQWKSGDYHLRYDVPPYYVLEKGTALAGKKPVDAPVQEMKIDYVTSLSAPGTLEIVRHPAAAAFGRGALAALPAYDPSSSDPWQVDLRATDLSRLDLQARLTDLLHADFDSVTTWPRALPRGFDPARFMELGKDPGLGLRKLHAQGHTGKGIGIAIIDQDLLVDHVEYNDRLRLYEEIHWPGAGESSMHAPAVASIAAGATVGVAPEADLYFIANGMGITMTSGEFRYELSTLAASIDRVVAVNAGLPSDRRIRVISISLGINPAMNGYDLVAASIEKAAAAGIYVAYVGSDPFLGVGRDPAMDPNDFSAYGPGDFWKASPSAARGMLLVPMDSRCTASPTGVNDYVFYASGGMSWTVPWVAGLYALACQERAAITPERFWAAAKASARTTGVGEIIDPEKLLAEIARDD